MKAFILAAGLGTRLSPLTDNQPKVMVEVAGRKILERVISQLKVAGVNDLVINTHYFPEVVTRYFGDGSNWGVRIQYSLEEEILGTAGGLKKCESHFDLESEFLVVYGDNVYDLDFKNIVNEPFKNSSCIVMLFDRNKNPNSGAAGGVVEVNNDGNITAFWEGLEHPEIAYVNAGVYKCKPEILKLIPKNTFCDFGKEIFPQMLEKNMPLQAFVIKPEEAVFGVDTMQYLEKANQYFANHI